jgi:hypothetical protein
MDGNHSYWAKRELVLQQSQAPLQVLFRVAALIEVVIRADAADLQQNKYTRQ